MTIIDWLSVAMMAVLFATRSFVDSAAVRDCANQLRRIADASENSAAAQRSADIADWNRDRL